MRDAFLDQLRQVERIASFPKWRRALRHPLKYFSAILHRLLIYPVTRKEWLTRSQTFFGYRMALLLPSSTDIYLTGGKSHASEVQLAKFLILNLVSGDTFVDAGSHYGYFSLLAATLVGTDGKVLSIEAAPATFKILSSNVASLSQVQAFHCALSDKTETLLFYEFPNLFSEYNTLSPEQFQNESWIKQYPPREVKIDARRLDTLLQEYQVNPKIIKIDVEGAEYQVVTGLLDHLNLHSPMIVLEYLSENRSNQNHSQAAAQLKAKGYESFVIDEQGKLMKVSDINQYMKEHLLDSENIVFKR